MCIIEIFLQGAHVLVSGHLDDLVHRLARRHRRGDEPPPQTVATDVEIVDGLAGSPLDHQVDTLRPQGVCHQLSPAIHPAKQGALSNPASFQPLLQCRHWAIPDARNECYLRFMELMFAWLETKAYPLPHKLHVIHLDPGRFRPAQGATEHQEQQGVIPKSRQVPGIYRVQHAGQWFQGQRPRFAFAVITEPYYAPHHLLYLRMLGRHGVDPLLLEGIANAGKPSYQGGRFARFPVAKLPLPFFLVEPDPVGQDAVGLIRQKIHDVVVCRLQGIQPVKLAPGDKDAGICLIGIEGGVGFGAAQEASCPAVQLRIEDALQGLLNWVLKAWVVHLTL